MMLNKIIDLSLKYKLLVIVLFMTLSFLGYRAYLSVPIDAFPDITPKQVVIYTESVGNSAEDIEKLITYPLESALSGMAGVKSIMSNSFFGLSYVSVFFEDEYDIYFLRQQMSERILSVDIPKGWGKPTLGPNTTGLGQVFWYELQDSTKSKTLQEIRALQDFFVKPMFKAVSGVEEVVSWGGYEKQYEVLIDTKKLQIKGVTYAQIVEAIQSSNLSAGGQYLEFNREQYQIRGVGFYKNLDDIRATVIKSLSGRAVSIGDVATVQEGNAPRFGAISIDGRESVISMVLQRTGTDANKVVKGLKEKMIQVNATLPKGLSINPIYDRTEMTQKAVATISNALIVGMILVAIVLFLFLFEFRSAFIVIVSLPLSLLIAFLLMQQYGLSANLMSLSGLAIAVGMIVDGTIVMVENAYRHLNANPNANKFELILNAGKEVAAPVTFAILIIVAVFIPLLSLDGLAGKLYGPMALNIVFVMLGSLLVALVLVPVLSIMLLKPRKEEENVVMKVIKWFYLPFLNGVLRFPKMVLFLVSMAFFFSIYLLSLQGREFMPTLNEESIMYRVIAPPGTALSQSIETAQNVENHILKNYGSEIKSVLSMAGRSEKGETAQPNYMEVLLTLKPNIEDLELLSKKMTKDLTHTFEHVRFVPTQPIAMRIEELLEGVQSELAIKIYGEEQKVMAKLSQEIQEVLEGLKGLEEVEVEPQLGQANIIIEPNYQALGRYGISLAEIMQVIRNGIGEEPISQKIEGVKRFGIVAKIKGARQEIEQLKAISIRSSSGVIVALEDVCHIEVKQGAAFIKRQNLSRYMVLGIETEGRDVASLVAEANERIKKSVVFPSGYFIEWAGDFKNMQEATEKLMMIIPLTILLILLLLYTAFNSMKKALLVLMNVPFGLMGGIVALIISGIYVSVSAIIGFLAIFAIAILNGIVLVTFIDELQEKEPDRDLKEVIKEATLLRLRPVLMTAFTTLFGILPLLYATGVGSEIQYPLSVVIVGGIISSTLLTLLVLPVGYFLFGRSKV
ncbi:MAG: Cobalt-zinc-cadmium resistance protein CzcA; Cation efflux system protein CusA [uncultured Sulfurovum sp.]|uniref:Cobalt-zinc-cadmium resistance protein CzcA Cation efflux system protein CusA n=1 Tax=uncultured Sulfurovum sp. TaxID=269237 RepID=A0A6S6SEL5_9BACT|nr:MAG: Cobalt-zinc-cadmium resistance protein CzcA; Cation efflux system protein CusA [uncultured Sulfurovum sp.]